MAINHNNIGVRNINIDNCDYTCYVYKDIVTDSYTIRLTDNKTHYTINSNVIFNTLRIEEDQINEIIHYLHKQHIHHEKMRPDYKHNGPTNEELMKYPALMEAWNEFKMIYTLSTGKKL